MHPTFLELSEKHKERYHAIRRNRNNQLDGHARKLYYLLNETQNSIGKQNRDSSDGRRLTKVAL